MTQPDDLAFELLQAAAATPRAAIDHLIALGARPALVAGLYGAGELAVGRVSISRDGASWEPGGPDRRLLIGLRAEDGTLIDVAAIASHRRDEWALRTGLGWALGIEAIERVHAALLAERSQREARLRLYATPFDWLAAGGDGLCVLEWTAAALAELRLLGARAVIEVEPAMKDRLKGMLAHGGLPRVEARQSVRRVA